MLPTVESYFHEYFYVPVIHLAMGSSENRKQHAPPGLAASTAVAAAGREEEIRIGGAHNGELSDREVHVIAFPRGNDVRLRLRAVIIAGLFFP